MKHTNETPTCPSCEERLKSVHQDLADWFRNRVKPAYPSCHIAWGWRGEADQERAFLDGKTKLHFPLSAHNKCDDHGNPCSLALDLFKLDDKGIAQWPWKYFYEISEMAALAKDPIQWGGLWTHLGDADHYSLVVSGDRAH